tara:strand:- start:454 stop:1020 length:567 start_codon:yes stop_codon:yes gene_type:complete
VSVSGWGRGTWGGGAWNQEIPISVTGVSATASAGSVTPAGSVLHGVPGVAATGAVGTLVIKGSAAFSATGVVGTSALGEETTNCSANVVGVGAVATTGLGEEGVSGSSLLSLTGVLGTGTADTGTIAPIQSIGFFLTGVTATGNIGIVLIYLDVLPVQVPNWTVVTGATTTWGETVPSQTPSWSEKAA